MDGPGHNPANAHPMPNNTDPVTNGTSILLLAGIEKFKSNNGAFFAVMTQATLMGIMAPAITKAKVESQWPKISSQPCTFAVSVIPDIKRPLPNSEPDKRDTTSLFILSPTKI